MPTLLAIGAHFDDCVFGIPGVLLDAVARHYRVVILTIIGDYSNWKPTEGRAQQFVDESIEISKRFGVEMRYLTYASMRFGFTEDAKRDAAKVVAEIKPDVSFILWPQDRHPDHEAASLIAKTALHGADRLVEAPGWRPPRRVYQFDNGPGHTIGFEPDTYVDVSQHWPRAAEWLNRYMALQENRPYDGGHMHRAVDVKRVLTEYRGLACGARYAEAFKSLRAYQQDVLG